jgi:hypothetical protein
MQSMYNPPVSSEFGFMLMESAEKSHSVWSEPEKAAVRAQLERLLANAHFNQSKRFPSFLRFVIEHTLAGDADSIKERTLGVEIFGRGPDYDTSSDPIVRVTAAEIRKRVAQYYQEAGHEGELRITLPSGSYVPQFRWPDGGHESEHAELPLARVETAAPLIPHAMELIPPRSGLRRRWFAPVLLAAILLLSALGAYFIWQARHLSTFDFFWHPILTANDPVLLCIADQLQYSGIALRDAGQPTHQVLLKDNLTAVVIDDVESIVKVGGILQASGKRYKVKGEGATDLTDLRAGPTIFVGAFDNAWTLRLTNPLRFHFANDPEMTQFRIVDSLAPGQSRWVVDRNVQMTTNNYRDYAIVARFTDTNTGKLEIVVAGIGRGGTVAASEFLTDTSDLSELTRVAKAAGDKKNMEIVLSTQIIDGQPGSPKMEASYFW